MKQFIITSLENGKRVTKSYMATSAQEAMFRVTGKGVVILKIIETPTQREKCFPLSLFLQELIALLEAGLVVIEAIEALRDSQRDKMSHLVLTTLTQKLYEGAQLSQAMSALPTIFPPLLINTVASSEQTGHLSTALSRFQFYESRMEELRKRVKSTLLYPMIVLSAGGVIMFFLLGFIIPRFSVVFEGMKHPSDSARLIMWWGKLTQTHGTLLLTGCGITIFAIAMAVRSAHFRQGVMNIVLAIPQLRQQHHLSVLVRFYRTLGLLLQGGLAVPVALALGREILPHSYQQHLEAVIRDVSAGESFCQTLVQHNMTTPVAARLLHVGERGGELATMCERIAAFYDDALDRAIEKFSKIFEPVLMMIVGGLVGLVVFLLYMPIFELAEGVQ
ncbi:type II secretion system F family protein [Enterobacter sp. RHBSTW-00994]|nr:type II secretion system F family protein [Enterobacter sp. RHBSTW-00994]